MYVRLVWGCNYMWVCFLCGYFHWIDFDTKFMSLFFIFLLFIMFKFGFNMLLDLVCWYFVEY